MELIEKKCMLWFKVDFMKLYKVVILLFICSCSETKVDIVIDEFRHSNLIADSLYYTNMDSSLAIVNRNLRTYKYQGYKHERAKAFMIKYRVQEFRSQFDSSVVTLDSVLSNTNELDSLHQLAVLIKGNIFFVRNNYTEAKNEYSKILNYEKTYISLLGYANLNTGLILFEEKKLFKKTKYMQNALICFEAMNDNYGIAHYYLNMANQTDYRINFRKCIEYLNITRKMFKQVPSDELKFNVYNQLAHIYSQKGETDSVSLYINKLKELPENSINYQLKSQIIFLEGVLAYISKDYQKAIHYFDSIVRSDLGELYLQYMYNYYVETYLKIKDFSKAREYLEKLKRENKRAYDSLNVKYYENIGKYKFAYKLNTLYTNKSDSIFKERRQTEIKQYTDYYKGQVEKYNSLIINQRNELLESRLKWQKRQIYILVLILISVSISIYLFYKKIKKFNLIQENLNIKTKNRNKVINDVANGIKTPITNMTVLIGALNTSKISVPYKQRVSMYSDIVELSVLTENHITDVLTQHKLKFSVPQVKNVNISEFLNDYIGKYFNDISSLILISNNLNITYKINLLKLDDILNPCFVFVQKSVDKTLKVLLTCSKHDLDYLILDFVLRLKNEANQEGIFFKDLMDADCYKYVQAGNKVNISVKIENNRL